MPADGADALTFEGEVWWWRGPAPYHFVTVPPEETADIRAVASDVSYGWGMIPVQVTIGTTSWTTSLWPKDGAYVVPLKDAVRSAASVELGDVVTITLWIAPRRRR
jgi:hypothetical protein